MSSTVTFREGMAEAMSRRWSAKGDGPLTRGRLEVCAGRVAWWASALLFSGSALAQSTFLQKGFIPTTIAPGASSQLTFAVTNLAASPAQLVTFVDTLPSGLRVAAAANKGGTCANAAAATTATSGGTSVTVVNLQVPAGPSSCSVTVMISNAPDQYNADCSQLPSAFTNGPSNVSASVVNAVVPSCLVVDRLFASGFEPLRTLHKAFNPAAIVAGASTELTFTVTVPSGFASRSDIGFVDNLPSGLRVASPASVGGTCANAVGATTAASGSTSITVTNLAVPPGPSSCTVTVRVTNAAGQFNASCNAQPATFTNSRANIGTVNVLNAVVPSCLVVQ